MDNFEEIRITAPRPGTCRVCATAHRRDMPHDRDSLYYQNKFYMKHRRFPTWADAMAHCTDEVKAAFAETLKERGISVGGDGDGDGGRLEK